jgi:hypothetical protein
LTSTATIITHQNTSASGNEAFIKNEKEASAPPQAPPRPAPRSLSTQNSIPMTNGTNTTSDDAAQVRYEIFLLSAFHVNIFYASFWPEEIFQITLPKPPTSPLFSKPHYYVFVEGEKKTENFIVTLVPLSRFLP